MIESPGEDEFDRAGRVTIIDVVRRAGVSKSTVSLVLSGSRLVAEATRVRVNEAMRALGYVYHRGAASLRASSSDLVGMVINDITNPFFAELTAGIEDALYGRGFTPILANTDENPTGKRKCCEQCGNTALPASLSAPRAAPTRGRWRSNGPPIFPQSSRYGAWFAALRWSRQSEG